MGVRERGVVAEIERKGATGIEKQNFRQNDDELVRTPTQQFQLLQIHRYFESIDR